MTTVVVPPLVTALLLACGTGAFFGLRWANGVVGGAGWATVATPADGGGQNGAEGCVVGRWKITSIEENSEVADFGLVHFTGSGGTLTFAANGTGVYDHAGMVSTAKAGGRTLTVSFAGAATFQYQVRSGMVAFDYQTTTVSATVQVNEVQAPMVAVADEDGSFKLSCGGTSMTVEAENGEYVATRTRT